MRGGRRSRKGIASRRRRRSAGSSTGRSHHERELLAAGGHHLRPGKHTIRVYGRADGTFLHLAYMHDVPLIWFD